ncbi:MAG: gliding motility-associated C-terminal domain-containing protein [Chitinophagaceae bacterium]|nr:gliding motility-associated C-terminal domain-containing protein [Chitinophagaceae bacterium]
MKYTPRLFLLLFLFLLSKITYSDTFTVTSNADSGPGTLREAIELANANGTAIIDHIHFNIANTTLAGRTITLLSYLPAFTSNIVLDASTQPGPSFGVSSAKIRITTNGSQTYSQCFILRNVENIEIYGFYITEFRYGDPNGPYILRCAIWMENVVKNIKIGAPGKGNVFFNNGLAICTPYGYSVNEGHHFSDIDIKSNFFNLDIDGITYTRYDAGSCILISSFTNITIGGDNVSDGNFFAGLNGNSAVLISDNNTGNGVLNIKNNKFGITFDQSSVVPCGALNVVGYEFNLWQQTRSDLEVNIINNTFRNPAVQFSNDCHEMISLFRIVGFITITGNKIGYPDGYGDCQTSGIVLEECKMGIIGGDDEEDQNIISSNSYAGIALHNNENITIKKNTIVCNSKGIEASSSVVEVPFVKIMTTNNVDYIAGTATPNCVIEVFQNIKQCIQCNNGEVYMGKTVSDADGNWSFSGAFSAPITARATSMSGVSGEFSAAKFIQATDYMGPTCGKENGYIKGTQLVSGTRYYWIRRNNWQTDTIFNTLDLVDVGPGYYEFVVEQTKYCSVSYALQLQDLSPKIYAQYIQSKNPSCGLANGSIVGLAGTGLYDKVYWLSANRDTVSAILDLENVPDGRYKLFVLNEKGGCGDSTDYYTLTNQSGPTLHDNNLQITTATCGNLNGSITGITVSNHIGSMNIEWRDSANNFVGSSFNLLNQPAGKYLLKFKDDSGCDTIKVYFTIPSTGTIEINTAEAKIVAAGCAVSNGSISNIRINGANSWQWKNTQDSSIVGNAVDVFLLPAGNYQLTATNQYNCSTSSPIIVIPSGEFADISPMNPSATNAACGQNNGEIKITGFTNENALSAYQWINGSTNDKLGSQLKIEGLGAGNYKLMVTDTNGCVKSIYSADIIVGAKPYIDNSSVNIINDKCDLKEAGISGIQVKGLANTPSFIWTDENGRVAGTSLDVKNLGEGTYKLIVEDGDFCTIAGEEILITNDNNDPIPLYYDLIIPRNTSTVLKVNNYSTGKYLLYADAPGNQLIEENSTGIFNTDVLAVDTRFYIKHVNGACNSVIKQVNVTVVDKSEFAVPSAFTPNGDNLNDILHVKVLGYVSLEYFRIFNRFGKEVFRAKNINDGWDGKINGKEQPSGVFIWMAKGKDLLGNIVEAKGTVMLIH